jgi:hypothetical protein
MRTNASTIEVDRPATEVFAYVTDPARFVEWQQAVVDGAMDSPGPQVVGARFRTTRQVGPMQRPFTSEIVHLDAPTRWRVRGIDGPIRATVDVEVVPLPEDRSRLTISIAFEGHGIGKVLVPLAVEPGVPKEMARDTATLKQLLEGGRASA